MSEADKVAFVSGHSGGGIVEAISCAALPLVRVARRAAIRDLSSAGGRLVQACSLAAHSASRLSSSSRSTRAIQTAVLSVLLPLAVSRGAVGDLLRAGLGVAGGAGLLVAALLRSVRNGDDARAAIDMARGAVMAMTVVCILAVDFHVFPRAFAKTEEFGTSVMDLGVGAMAFTGGLVSATARGGGGSFPRSSRSWATAAALLVLGLGRVLALRGVNYHEHVSEYGVHWNFFITLAALRGADVLTAPLPWHRLIKLSALLAAAVALLFSSPALVRWVLSAPRDNLWQANREGLVSLPGFLLLWLAGALLARHVGLHARDPVTRKRGDQSRPSPSLRHAASACAAVLAAARLALWWLSTGGGGEPAALALRPSRRLCNLPYVLDVLLSGCALLVASDGAVACLPSPASRLGLALLSRHQLPVFLLANVLTGGINKSMDTLAVDDPSAIAIVVAYTAVTFTAGVGWLDPLLARLVPSTPPSASPRPGAPPRVR